MKKLFIVVIMIMSINGFSQSVKIDNWVKPDLEGKNWQNTASVFVSQKINEKMDFTTFLLTGTGGFSEALFGVSTKVGKKVSLGASIGFEAGVKNPLRFGSSFFIQNKSLSLLVLGEYGVNGSYWYKYYAKKTAKKVSYGIFGQRFCGHGLRFDTKIWKLNFWTAVTYDTETKSTNIPFGVYLMF